MTRKGHNLVRIILSMSLAATAALAHAQAANDVVRVNVPFDFNIGMQTFPAGEYTLKTLLPHTMMLRNEAGETLANILFNSVEARHAPETAKLVFNGYAGRYFLAQVWRVGDNVGGELPQAHAEIEVARSTPPRQLALRIVAQH